MPNKLAELKLEGESVEFQEIPPSQLKKRTDSWVWTYSLFQWSDLMVAAWKLSHPPEAKKQETES